MYEFKYSLLKYFNLKQEGLIITVFMAGKKHRKYWENLKKSLNIIRRLSLDVTAKLVITSEKQ